MTTQPVEIKRTYCRICMVHCGLVAEVAGDQILTVRGDKEHPLTSGYAMEEALCRTLGTPAKFSPLTIDGTAKTMVAGALGGFPGLNPKTDYDNVEMLIYVGTNPMVSHAHNTGMFDSSPSSRSMACRTYGRRSRSSTSTSTPRSCTTS